MRTVGSSTNGDYDLTTSGGVSVYNQTPNASHPLRVYAHIELGDGTKNLTATGGNFLIEIQLGGIAIDGGQITKVLGTDTRAIIQTDEFLVPANTAVAITIESPNADTDVDVTVQLYDSTPMQVTTSSLGRQADISSAGVVYVDVLRISGDETAADNLEAMLDGTGATLTLSNTLSVNTTEWAGGTVALNGGIPSVSADYWAGTSTIIDGTSGYPVVDMGAVYSSTSDVIGLGSMGNDYSSNSYLGANVTHWNSTTVATEDTPGYPVVTIKSGTGTGELSLVLGEVTVYANNDKNNYFIDGTKTTLDALNDVSTAEVNAEVDTALTDIHLDHLLATAYDPSSKPGASDALLNELVENDAGVSRFTTNALENASGGSGLTPLASGVAQAGTSTTIVLAASSSFADDELNGTVINIISGTGQGQSRVITDYVGSTDTATVSPNWTTNPDSSSNYEVVHGSVNISVIDGSDTYVTGLYSMAADYETNSALYADCTRIESADATDTITALVDASLVSIGLDHVFSTSIADTDVADDSWAAKMVDYNSPADFTNWDHTTHSMSNLLRSVTPTYGVKLYWSGSGDEGWPRTYVEATDMAGLNALDTYYTTESVGVYHADVLVDIDDTNAKDEYTILWMQDAIAQVPGTDVSTPTLEVIDRTGASVFSTTPSTVSGHAYKHDETTNRLSVGESYVVVVTATIDGSTRTWKRIVGRDDLT